jgi:hypothetical protein
MTQNNHQPAALIWQAALDTVMAGLRAGHLFLHKPAVKAPASKALRRKMAATVAGHDGSRDGSAGSPSWRSPPENAGCCETR